tara:strand:+ start:1051 stop:1437 length:387 start_codon:yes stop_codon:yes gene_type:complete
MSTDKSKSNWVPEIEYEEADDGLTSKIPFIQVPEDEEMPVLLYVFESRDTGEVEPGPEGEELPVTEITLHQYANMGVCKRRMSPIEYDNLRFTLGLESMRDAAIKGQEITTNIRQRLETVPQTGEENA